VGTQSHRSRGQAWDSGAAGPDDVAALVSEAQQRTGPSRDADPAPGGSPRTTALMLPGVVLEFVHCTGGFGCQMLHSA